MQIIDIIRLATERAEQTGDISRPEFHDELSNLGRRVGDHELASKALETAIALRKVEAAQMEFRKLFEK